MKESEIYEELLISGVIQEGHFVLSSGLHSNRYLQCARLFMRPHATVRVINALVQKVLQVIKLHDIDIVVSPAIGGIIVGYEMARQLNRNAIFCERVNGKFIFRRSFEIAPAQKVLIVEDVVTTAKSSVEVIKLLEQYKVEIIAEAALIDRSSGIAQQKLTCPFIPLLQITASTYTEDNLPDELKKVPITTPGSRFIINHKSSE